MDVMQLRTDGRNDPGGPSRASGLSWWLLRPRPVSEGLAQMTEDLQPSRRVVSWPIYLTIREQFPDAANSDCEQLAFRISCDILHATEIDEDEWRIYPLKTANEYFDVEKGA
jgi:hypothetical protein